MDCSGNGAWSSSRAPDGNVLTFISFPTPESDCIFAAQFKTVNEHESHEEPAEKVRDLRHRAMRVFMRLGIRSVNMADLATELGISKKTLYKYFQDKRDLIVQCMDQHCGDMEEVITQASASEGNAIDVEWSLIRFVHETASQVHPSMLFDLQKYHPKAFALLTQKRDAMLLTTMEANIRRGQHEGLYRTDIAPEVAARFLVSIGNEVRKLAQEQAVDWSLPELFMQSALYHIQAISTPEGVTYLKSKIANELQS